MFIRTEKSSQIHSYSYSPEDEKMDFLFLCRQCKGQPQDPACVKCGGQQWVGHYRYPNVKADKYARIRDAESIGSAFHREIRNKQHEHPFEKIA